LRFAVQCLMRRAARSERTQSGKFAIVTQSPHD